MAVLVEAEQRKKDGIFFGDNNDIEVAVYHTPHPSHPPLPTLTTPHHLFPTPRHFQCSIMMSQMMSMYPATASGPAVCPPRGRAGRTGALRSVERASAPCLPCAPTLRPRGSPRTGICHGFQKEKMGGKRGEGKKREGGRKRKKSVIYRSNILSM